MTDRTEFKIIEPFNCNTFGPVGTPFILSADGNEDVYGGEEYHAYHHECSCHYNDISLKEFANDVDPKIDPWTKCNNLSIPLPYFNHFTSKYQLFLIHHLQYTEQNSKCQCYWPYLSLTACKISDLVFDQIFPLLERSEFSTLHPNYNNWEYIETYPSAS